MLDAVAEAVEGTKTKKTSQEPLPSFSSGLADLFFTILLPPFRLELQKLRCCRFDGQSNSLNWEARKEFKDVQEASEGDGTRTAAVPG